MKIRNFLFLPDLDKKLAILTIFLAIILIIYLKLTFDRFIYIIVGILTLASCAIWLLIRQKASLGRLELQSRSVYLTLNVFFFIFLTGSVLSIQFRSDLYTRPLIYFIFASLMAGSVALEILFCPQKKKYLFLILFQIVIIGVSLQWSQILIFSGVVGIDPWYHQAFTQKILNMGFIPDGMGYSKLPLMHLGIASTSLITGLNYKMSTMLSMSFLQVLCGVLFTYLIGKFLLNYKVGLLAGLLLIVANKYISFGFWTIPNTIAAVLIPIIIYLLFKVKLKNPLKSKSLTVLLMITLILTHTIVAMAMSIILLVIWIFYGIYIILHHKRKKMPVTFAIVSFFTVAMFSWWSYASGQITKLAELIKWGFSRDVFVSAPKEIYGYQFTVPIYEQLFNNLGMFLFFSLSFIGCFYMISRKYGNSRTFTLAFAGLIPLFIGFFTLILKYHVLEERWFYMSQILLALPLAIAFLLLCNIIRKKFARPLLLSTFIIFLSFLMIMSPITNLDNPAFSPNIGVRYALIESEFQAIETISQKWGGIIESDRYYALESMSHLGYNTESVSYSFYNKNFLGNDTIILIREEIVNKPFKLYDSAYKLSYNPKQLLERQGFSEIYDCGSVGGFSR